MCTFFSLLNNCSKSLFAGQRYHVKLQFQFPGWLCPWSCWTLFNTQRSCSGSDCRNCWSRSASPSPKGKGKPDMVQVRGRRWRKALQRCTRVKISFSLCLPPLYTVAKRRQRKRNSRVQWKAEGSRWAHQWLSAAGWGGLGASLLLGFKG